MADQPKSLSDVKVILEEALKVVNELEAGTIGNQKTEDPAPTEEPTPEEQDNPAPPTA